MVYLNGIFLLGFEFDSTCSVPNIIFLLIYIPWTPMIYIYMIIYVYYIYNVYVCINPSCIILHSHLPISYPVLNKWHFPHWSLAKATLKPTSPLLWLWPVLDYENHGFKYHKYTDSKIYDLQVADGQLLLVVYLPMLWPRVCDWLFLMLTQGIVWGVEKEWSWTI
jgi:hypothetical protein